MVIEAIGIGVCGVMYNICFSTGHKIWGVIFSFGSITSFLALLATAVSRKHSKCKTWTAFGFVTAAAGIVFLLWAISLSKPQPVPYAHFEFVLINPVTGERTLELTNDFFNIDKLPPNSGYPGVVIFPVTQGSNFDLTFSLQNNGPEDAEAIDVMVSVSPAISYEPGAGWLGARGLSGYLLINPPNQPKEEKMSSYVYMLNQLLRGDADPFPPLHLHNLPIGNVAGYETINSTPAPVTLMAKAKDCPAQSVMMRLVFVLVPTSAPFMNPVAAKMNRVNGYDVLVLPQDIWNEAIKN
jgi:hypothetical protein